MNQTETAEMLGLDRASSRRRGLTILLIEHKLDMVMQLSDRVVVLDEGQQDRRRAGPPRCATTPGDRGLSRPSACRATAEQESAA